MRRRAVLAAVVGCGLLYAIAGWSQQPAEKTKRSHDPNVLEPLAIMIRPEGIIPKSLQLPYGLYAVAVFNRSGIQEPTLELDRVSAKSADAAVLERSASGAAKKHTARWIQNVDLKKGIYRLRVAERPSWYCLLEVQ